MIYGFTVIPGERHADDRVIELRKFRENPTGFRKALAFVSAPGLRRVLYQTPEGFKLSLRSYQIWKTGRVSSLSDFALAVMRERGLLIGRTDLKRKLEPEA